MLDVKLYLSEVGQRIMERRKKLGLTQEELAERCDLTTQYISYIESGKRSSRIENIMLVALELGTSIDFLLTGRIVDQDMLLLSEKMRMLSPAQIRSIENIIDECIALNHIKD